jgi:hypothetical protein
MVDCSSSLPHRDFPGCKLYSEFRIRRGETRRLTLRFRRSHVSKELEHHDRQPGNDAARSSSMAETMRLSVMSTPGDASDRYC